MMRISRRALCGGPSRTRFAPNAAAQKLKTPQENAEERKAAIEKIEQQLDAGKAAFQNNRVHNFSAGPAAIPQDVLLLAQRDLLNYQGTGIGFMELSHRDEDGPVHAMMKQLVSNMRNLLEIPSNYHVLFFQGGAHGQFSAVPLNLTEPGDTVDYIKTGIWGQKAIDEAAKYVNVNIAYDSEVDGERFIRDAKDWNLSPDSKYVHITMNETMSGLEFLNDPNIGDRILVADATSTLLSRPIDIEKYGMIYASSGKNLGPAGICMAIVRDDLLGKARSECPSIINWDKMAKSQPIPNIYNTPPTYLLYITQSIVCVFVCAKKLFSQHYMDTFGSLHAIEERAIGRADKVYNAIDNSAGFYRNVVDPSFRSRMNAVFRIGSGDREMEQKFCKSAEENGLYQLFGHPLMGGLRITLYNGIEDESVDRVIEFMKEFARENKGKIKE